MSNIFGYVVANTNKLTSEEKEQYRAYYCGLCRTLGKRHGIISRITLTYDMTFLVLFLSSLYRKNTAIAVERCAVHPMKQHKYLQNDITEYAADMNVALAYYKYLDDWKDDRKILPRCKAKLFERAYKQIKAQHPIQCAAIERCLRELSIIEKSGGLNPDIPANCFGDLMSAIFVLYEDEYAENLRRFGKALGKFIYIMDACLDLKADIQKERPNPMIAFPSEDFNAILNLLAADCVEIYRLLPIIQNKELIENILYSGIWTRYEAENQKRRHVNNDQ